MKIFNEAKKNSQLQDERGILEIKRQLSDREIMKRERRKTGDGAANLPYSASSVFVARVFSAEFIGFRFISLTFSLSDHPSPLLRPMSGSRVPERAIRIRIINIISFHCDPLPRPDAHTSTGHWEYCGGISSRLSI